MKPETSAVTVANRFSKTTLSLALAQTIFWASTFYLLPALLLNLEQNTAWTKVEISFAMTGSMILSALCARQTGSLIDKGYGKLLMSIGGTLAGLLLLLCSQATQLWQFYLCWAGIGVCMAAILYEPCFSIVTRHHGTNARRIITHITLIAGFAGTVSYPVANWLSAEFDWRLTFQFFGIAIVFLAVPCAYFAVTNLERQLPVTSEKAIQTSQTDNNRLLLFWLITGAFTLGSINHTMIISHMLPLLDERGIALQSAVFAAMLVGPMQVVGRFILMGFEKRISVQTSGFICLCGLAFSTALLWFSGVEIAAIYLATSVHGATWGLVSITRPTLIREVLGSASFGATSGSVAAVAIFGIALAPSIGAGLWSVGGYDLMLAVGFGFALIGSGLLWVMTKQSKLTTLNS